MIFSARKNGVRFNWVGFDSFYGDNLAFVRKLADNGEEFMADIYSDHRIYYEDPMPIVPFPKSNKGKSPVNFKPRHVPYEWTDGLPKNRPRHGNV